MQALIVVSFSANIWRKRVSSGGFRDGIHERKWLVGHLVVAGSARGGAGLRPLHMQCQVQKCNRRPLASTRWAVFFLFLRVVVLAIKWKEKSTMAICATILYLLIGGTVEASTLILETNNVNHPIEFKNTIITLRFVVDSSIDRNQPTGRFSAYSAVWSLVSASRFPPSIRIVLRLAHRMCFSTSDRSTKATVSWNQRWVSIITTMPRNS
jgi:hypothetical protein